MSLTTELKIEKLDIKVTTFVEISSRLGRENLRNHLAGVVTCVDSELGPKREILSNWLVSSGKKQVKN